jgi:hypothetical protein
VVKVAQLKRVWVAMVGAAAACVAAEALAFNKPPFPRLAANWIANQNYQDPTIQSALARGSIAIVNIWPGWENGRGTTLQQVIQNIKAINPNTLVFAYIMNDQIPANRGAYQPFAPLYAKLDAMAWYLYPTSGCSTPVTSYYPGYLTLNNTLYTPTDSNGEQWIDWFAKWAVANYYTPNPSLDGFSTDDVFWKPRVSGDWQRDGTTDRASDPKVQTWLRQGYVQHFTTLRQLMPGKFQIGNVADWGDTNSVLTEYQGLLDGGVMEGMIGHDWSPETYGGWQVMMARYRRTMAALGEPKLALFHQVGSVTDYQSVRYGLTSALMDDGYYVFNSTAQNGGDAPWFDEYQVQLGNAVGGPSTAAWQSGVYRRDFDNGIALVNPKGNGTQTVTLEASFTHFTGQQAPAVNNGATVTSVTLQDRDGIILMRSAP